MNLSTAQQFAPAARQAGTPLHRPAAASGVAALPQRRQPATSWRRSRARLTIAASAALPEAAAELEPAAQEQWAACSSLVQQRCGVDAETADAALLKAFGWKGQAFWRQERVKQVPDLEQVVAALDFLEGLGLSQPADLAALVRTFPEALGLRVEVMQENVGVLKDKWYMKGNVLVNAVKRKPRVLGNCIDCQGNCAGLCTRCWAQF